MNTLNADILRHIFAFVPYKPQLAAVCAQWRTALGEYPKCENEFVPYAFGIRDNPWPAFELLDSASEIVKARNQIITLNMACPHIGLTPNPHFNEKILTRIISHFCARGKHELAREIYAHKKWEEGLDVYPVLAPFFPEMEIKSVTRIDPREITPEVADFLIARNSESARIVMCEIVIESSRILYLSAPIKRVRAFMRVPGVIPSCLYSELTVYYKKSSEEILREFPLIEESTAPEIMMYARIMTCMRDIRNLGRNRPELNIEFRPELIYSYLIDSPPISYVDEIAYILINSTNPNYETKLHLLAWSGVIKRDLQGRDLLARVKSVIRILHDAGVFRSAEFIRACRSWPAIDKVKLKETKIKNLWCVGFGWHFEGPAPVNRQTRRDFSFLLELEDVRGLVRGG